MQHTVRIDEDVHAKLAKLAKPGESANAVIRRVMGLEPNQARRSDALRGCPATQLACSSTTSPRR